MQIRPSGTGWQTAVTATSALRPQPELSCTSEARYVTLPRPAARGLPVAREGAVRAAVGSAGRGCRRVPRCWGDGAEAAAAPRAIFKPPARPSWLRRARGAGALWGSGGWAGLVSTGAVCPVGERGGCCRRDWGLSQAGGGGAQPLAWAPAVPAAAVVAALRTAWRWAASVCSVPGERRLAGAASPSVWPTRRSLVPSGLCSSPFPAGAASLLKPHWNTSPTP